VRGTYITDIDHWTCSYLISRFLLCKHLVRSANQVLKDGPLTDLRFFFDLRRQHYLPFYMIPGIDKEASASNTSVTASVRVLGHRTMAVSDPVEVGNKESERVGEDEVQVRLSKVIGIYFAYLINCHKASVLL